jgi:iron complex outermembrane receptor protein
MFGRFSGVGRESGNELRTTTRQGGRGIEPAGGREDPGDRRLQQLWMLLLVALVTLTWGAGQASAAADAPEATDTPESTGATEAADTGAAATTDAGAATLTEEERQRIEVMVTTAKRRSQVLQKVPDAVTSFSSTELLDQGLTDFNDLQYNVPSLFSGLGLTKITLRGVGSEIVGPGIDPGFVVHVNNVYSSRETTGLIDFFDVERVDVLRGPQGTLWGRNSTGGAINIITKRPVFEFDANADIEYGNFQADANGVRIRGMVNLPLVEDQLAFRAAFLTNFNDGLMLMENGASSQRVTDAAMGTIRASLRWEPHDDVTVDVIGGWLLTDDAGSGRKFDGDYFTPDNVPDGFVYGATGDIEQSVPAWPGAGPGHDFTGALPNPDDPYRGTADEESDQNAKVWTATVLVGWEADRFKLDSITGFQMTNFFLHRDADTSSLPIATLDLVDKSRQISQEFLVNSTWEFPVNYTVGAIYQYDWTPRTELFTPNSLNTAESANWELYPSLGTPIDPPVSLVDGCGFPTGMPWGPLLGGVPPVPDPWEGKNCPPTSPFGEVRDDFVDAKTKVKNHVFGLYGNLSWEIIENLTVNAGGRFSYTYRDWNDQTLARNYSVFMNEVTFPLPPPLLPIRLVPPGGLQIEQRGLHQTKSWKAGTWKASVDYQLLDDHLLWASVGTGSRAGGFNFAEEQPFKDERVLAVEAGTKSMFFDDRLMLNLTGFWYDWKDPQIATTENALPITRNAPSATSYGIELEFRALPIDDLELNGSFGWLEAFYDEDWYSPDPTDIDYTEPVITERARMVNLNGVRVPRSPRFTASFGAQYSFDLGRCGTLIPRVDFYFRDDIAFRQYGNPKDITPRYTRTDVRLIWRSESGQWWGEVFARNLENNAVKTNQEIMATIYRVHFYAPPISGGFRLGYSFR